MSDKAARDELVSVYEEAMEATIDAQNDCADAKASIIAFDEQHPEVMREYHAELGDAKKKMRGSSGTVASAKGHASLAAAKGEGG